LGTDWSSVAGATKLDTIGTAAIAALNAALLAKKLGAKTRNNVLTVLSGLLKLAADNGHLAGLGPTKSIHRLRHTFWLRVAETGAPAGSNPLPGPPHHDGRDATPPARERRGSMRSTCSTAAAVSPPVPTAVEASWRQPCS
jgi:hypothetical protein